MTPNELTWTVLTDAHPGLSGLERDALDAFAADVPWAVFSGTVLDHLDRIGLDAVRARLVAVRHALHCVTTGDVNGEFPPGADIWGTGR